MFDARLSPFTRVWVVLQVLLWILMAGWVVYEVRVTSDAYPIDWDPMWGLVALWVTLFAVYPIVSILPSYEKEYPDTNSHYFIVLTVAWIFVYISGAIIVDSTYTGVEEIFIPQNTSVFDTKLDGDDYRCTLSEHEFSNGSVYWLCRPLSD